MYIGNRKAGRHDDARAPLLERPRALQHTRAASRRVPRRLSHEQQGQAHHRISARTACYCAVESWQRHGRGERPQVARQGAPGRAPCQGPLPGIIKSNEFLVSYFFTYLPRALSRSSTCYDREQWVSFVAFSPSSGLIESNGSFLGRSFSMCCMPRQGLLPCLLESNGPLLSSFLIYAARFNKDLCQV